MVRITPSASRTDNSPRRLGVSSVRSALALCVSVIALCWALPSAGTAQSGASVNAGESGVAASASVGGPGASAELSTNVLQVLNANGKAAELLHQLTIAQLAALLHKTTAELLGEVQALPGYGLLSGALGSLLEKPGATVQELLDAISAQGISLTPVKQLTETLLQGGVETAEQLRSVLATVLDDLAKNGQLSGLEQELGVPGGVMEVARLVPSTVGQAADTLGTTVEALGTLLQGAGGLSHLPTSGLSPIVTLPLEAVGGPGGASSVLGLPSGSGGLTLTTVNSTPATQAAAGVKPSNSSSVSNAFSIVSLKVTRAGAIVETVSLPGPGSLAVSASGPKVVAHRSVHGRTKVLTRRATVASLATQAAAGLRTVTLYPKRLGGGRRIPVSVATTYTPTGGSPNTIRRSVTITRATVRRKHRA
jgi:hypothetical protein